MKYKVGDKVLVVDAQLNIKYMQDMIGLVCEISKVKDTGAYELKEDQMHFGWLERWLEPAGQEYAQCEDAEIMNLIKGD